MKLEIRGLEKLSFRERQVVALKEMGSSAEQIAKRLNVSPSHGGYAVQPSPVQRATKW